jgi:hypothetical protein
MGGSCSTNEGEEEQVESSCEFGTESSGVMKCWETIEGLTTCGLSSSAQLHRVS